MVRKRNRLLYGVGINDSDYVTEIRETVGYTLDGKQKQVVVWRCPFFSCWRDMIKRCYSQTFKTKYPTYLECSSAESWHKFSSFKAWMEKQDWQGKHLDKDLLVLNNKLYSPETCVFLDKKVNLFLTESSASRGEWPIGVYFKKDMGKFVARCSQINGPKDKYLGKFDCPEEAHTTWLKFKIEQAKILASEIKDDRIAKALVARYENYKGVI